MWALKVASGPQAGQVFKLKRGKNKFGRSPACDFMISGQGISKEHFVIEVLEEKAIISDLRSSNGTFINGVKIQSANLVSGDAIVLQDAIFVFSEVLKIEKHVRREKPLSNLPALDQHHLQSQNPNSVQASWAMPPASEASHSSPPTAELKSAENGIIKAIDEKFVPAFDGFLENFSLRAVILGFAVTFIFISTFLSMIPLKMITAESIGSESQRRALTIARSLAAQNQKSLGSEEIRSFTTELFIREEGVQDIYVLSNQGKILAPAERAGFLPKESAFAKKIQGKMRETSEILDDGRVAASFPIIRFDPEQQLNGATAHVVVIYDPGALAFDDKRALSLFVQVFAIALLAGGVLFFLLSRVIDSIVIGLNQKLDQSLRDGQEVTSSVQWEPLQNLLVNINTLLQRSSGGSNQSENMHLYWIEAIDDLAFVMNSDLQILNVNRSFEERTSMERSFIEGQPLQAFTNNFLQSKTLEVIQILQSQGGVAQLPYEMDQAPALLTAQYLNSERSIILIKVTKSLEPQFSGAA